MMNLIASYLRRVVATNRMVEQAASVVSEYVDTDAALPVVSQRPMSSLGISGAISGFEDSVRRIRALQVARWAYSNYGHARNVIHQRVNHIAGDDFAVRFLDEEIQEKYRTEAKRLRLRRIFKDIVKRNERDGEVFLFKTGDDELRFVSPEFIFTPPDKYGDEKVVDGVLLEDPDDPVSVTGYFINEEFFSSERVFHIKSFESDFDCIRGWPVLADAIEYMRRYEQFVDARNKLNIFRSAIMLFRKHVGKGSSEIQSYVDRVKSGTILRRDGQTEPFTNFASGRIVDHSDKTEYEFKSPNTGATEASEDGRAMRLQAATFFQMPEYMYTSDASNANYASTAVAESPGVKAMSSLQKDYGEEFERLLVWIDKDFLEPTITWPVLINRDELRQVQALNLENIAGTLSRQTWMQMRGRDPRIEEERIKSEPPRQNNAYDGMRGENDSGGKKQSQYGETI